MIFFFLFFLMLIFFFFLMMIFFFWMMIFFFFFWMLIIASLLMNSWGEGAYLNFAIFFGAKPKKKALVVHGYEHLTFFGAKPWKRQIKKYCEYSELYNFFGANPEEDCELCLQVIAADGEQKAARALKVSSPYLSNPLYIHRSTISSKRFSYLSKVSIFIQSTIG